MIKLTTPFWGFLSIIFTASWTAFRDNETDIWGYTWSAGSSVCGSDIQPFEDPHSHLASSSYWTYEATATDLHLPDGTYYVTVQGLYNFASLYFTHFESCKWYLFTMAYIYIVARTRLRGQISRILIFCMTVYR